MADKDGKKPLSRRAGDVDVLALAEGLLTSLGETFDAADLKTLRDVAESYPDAGKDGGGDVVKSLAGLLDDFLATGAYDRAAVVVHVRAWRFMVSRKPDRAEQAAVMQGLRDVRELYAAPAAA